MSVRTVTETGSPPIVVSAAASLAVLVIAFGWQLGSTARAQSAKLAETAPEEVLIAPNPNWRNELKSAGVIASTTNSLPSAASGDVSYTDAAWSELIGTYVTLKRGDSFTDETSAALVESVATSVTPPVEFLSVSSEAIRTDTDNSPERILAYREDLSKATAPILALDEPEIAVYGRYIESKDPRDLEEVRRIATAYAEAAAGAALVTVPDRLQAAHLDVVNALGAYGAALDSLARFADDPIASIALLRAYDDAEREMFSAYDALRTHFTNL